MKSTVNDAIQYARDVVSGKIVACKDVISQCQIFVEDYDNRQKDSAFRWKFNRAKAEHVLSYIQLLNFVEGTVAGQNVRLSPWQAFIFINAYGWVDKNDSDIRRYTRLICLVGRKNAKSTIMATLALYELMYAPEGSQLVTMATQREQAKLVWGMSARMADRSDARLTDGYKIANSVISNIKKWNRYTPLSKESKRLDGLNIRLAIADESAAIEDANLFEVVSSSMGAQKSPQFWHITTGQPGAQSKPFYAQLDYAKKVLNGIISDDRIFCLAYAIDEGDEWDDEAVWIKSNPNLGVSVSLEFLQEEKKVAQEISTARANFRTKYCNEFISTSESWIDVNVWNKNAIPLLDKEKPLYVGLDLGATDDLTAVSMLWAGEGQFHFDARCFIPEYAVKNAPKHVQGIYQQAIEDGSLIVTEGDIRDDNAIFNYVVDLHNDYGIKEVAYDSWSATHLTARLEEAGLELVKFGQGIAAISPASKEAEVLIRKGELKHLGVPLLAWQLSNVEVWEDVNENIKLRKGNDRALKIDAIIALVMAVGRATAHGANDKKPEFQFFF